MKNQIEVAAGLIWKESQILITQRRPDDSFGGLWEFPGGKRKPNETLTDCLIREIKEELEIEIVVGELIIQVSHLCPEGVPMTLFLFNCQMLAGKPQTIGCADWRWIGVDEFKFYHFIDLDQQIIQKLFTTRPLIPGHLN